MKFLVHKKETNCNENFREKVVADQISAYVIYEWSPKESSRADMPWTSVTSPYLHWGQLSPRTVLHEALSRGRDAAKFRRKLAWLVHAHYF